MHNAFLPIVSAYSAFTASWIGFIVHIARKDEDTDMQESEQARDQRLIAERYGPSFCRLDEKTGLYWIITESGDILDSGDSEKEAWKHSAFQRYSHSSNSTEDVLALSVE